MENEILERVLRACEQNLMIFLFFYIFGRKKFTT